MTKSQAGRAGGKALVRKYGRDHMRKIGRRGGRVTNERYSIQPVGLARYAMVDRVTKKVKVVF
jgi:hypothetical protein